MMKLYVNQTKFVVTLFVSNGENIFCIIIYKVLKIKQAYVNTNLVLNKLVKVLESVMTNFRKQNVLQNVFFIQRLQNLQHSKQTEGFHSKY